MRFCFFLCNQRSDSALCFQRLQHPTVKQTGASLSRGVMKGKTAAALVFNLVRENAVWSDAGVISHLRSLCGLFDTDTDCFSASISQAGLHI